MNGVHDLGGMHGFGPVERHPDSLRFEHDWEPAVVAIQAATRAFANIDQFRHAIERMDPVHYLGSTYFEHWLDGCERLAVEAGVLGEHEVDERCEQLASGWTPLERPADPVHQASPRPDFRRGAATAPRFPAGTEVRTRNLQPAGHTRLARYARGKRGVVADYHGSYVYANANAHGLGEDPDHLYSVRFEAAELWGDTSSGRESVYIDLYERYLLAAEG